MKSHRAITFVELVFVTVLVLVGLLVLAKFVMGNHRWELSAVNADAKQSREADVLSAQFGDQQSKGILFGESSAADAARNYRAVSIGVPKSKRMDDSKQSGASTLKSSEYNPPGVEDPDDLGRERVPTLKKVNSSEYNPPGVEDPDDLGRPRKP